jgi:hypothetical protein
VIGSEPILGYDCLNRCDSRALSHQNSRKILAVAGAGIVNS